MREEYNSKGLSKEFMNRKMKFRLYDKFMDKMIYPSELKENSFETYYMNLINGKIELYQNCYDGGFFEEDVIVMPFTGFYDIYKKEIYEGDILQIGVDMAYVKWNNKYGYFQLIPIGEYYFDSDILGQVLEYSEARIIGNIIDNKNLLI